MRTSFSWRLLVTRLVQTLSAEYSGLPTAAKRGQKFCLKMKTPAGSMSFLIRTIRTLFSLHCGRVDDSRFRQRAWYFSKVYADPKSADTVYLLNTGLFRSVDGGKTFNLLPARHGDHHGLWIDPQNPNRIANANDGGVSISLDGGKTW